VAADRALAEVLAGFDPALVVDLLDAFDAGRDAFDAGRRVVVRSIGLLTAAKLPGATCPNGGAESPQRRRPNDLAHRVALAARPPLDEYR
jgi:hypothetical protein